MNDFLNRYSGWISILSIVLSIPVGIWINMISPKIANWFAFRSKNRRLSRIQELERQISEIESLKADSILAISKFTNLSHNGLARQLFLLLIFVGLNTFSSSVSYLSRPESAFSQLLNTPMPISAGLLFLWTTLITFLISGALVMFASAPTFRLQELTYRVENFEKWREQTLVKIEELRKEQPTL